MVNSYLSAFDDEARALYREIILYLSEIGYNPYKQKSSITFKHDQHNKQMAKMGTTIKKGKPPAPWFSLRFSACREYSQRIEDIISALIVKVTATNRYRLARCMTGECNYCGGEPGTHVYTHVYPDGTVKTSCGAYAMEIPGLTAGDVPEIKRLIAEEHGYLMEHEAGAS